MGWLASIASIAGIAERIITKFINPDPAAASSPVVGTVVWGLDSKGRKITAKNIGKEEVGLLFTKPESDGGNVSLYQPLQAGKGYDATGDFSEFSDGSLSIAPVVDSAADNFGRIVTGTFRLLGVGIVVNMIRGVTFRYNKTPTGFDATLETTGPEIKRVDIRAVDLQKNSTQTTVEFKQGSAVGNAVTVPLPAGVNLEPAAEEIMVTVEIDEASYEEAVADRRQLELDSD
jgi:hypothetical protein